MATVVTRTIRPSGGDYTSIESWQAGEQRDLVAANEIARAECGSFTDPAIGFSLLGWTTDGTRHVIIEAAPEARHNGVWDAPNRYRLHMTGTNYIGVWFAQNDTIVRGIQIHKQCPVLPNDIEQVARCTAAILMDGVMVTYTQPLVAADDPSGFYISNFWPNRTNQGFINCIAFGVRDGAGKGRGFSIDTSDPDFLVYNNTAVDCRIGFQGYPQYYKNNIAACDIGFVVDEVGWREYAANLSTDNTAPLGNGGIRNAVVTFENPTARDYRLAATDTSGAKDSGADLSIDTRRVVTTDIAGITRPQGSGFDIGAFEYVSGGPPPPTRDVRVTATAYSDPDGDPGERNWRVYAAGTSTVVEITGWQSPTTQQIFSLPAGSYEFTVQDRDNKGAQTPESTRVLFTVEDEVAGPQHKATFAATAPATALAVTLSKAVEQRVPTVPVLLLPDNGEAVSGPLVIEWKASTLYFELPAGLVSHHDALAIEGVSAGAALQQFDDLSGAGRHLVQATVDRRPTYEVVNGLPCVRCSIAGPRWMASAVYAEMAQPTTTFVVARYYGSWTETNPAKTLFAGGSSLGTTHQLHLLYSFPADYNPGDSIWYNGGTLIFPNAAWQNRCVYTLIADGASSLVNVNGGTDVVGSTGARPIRQHSIGARVGGDVNGSVEIHELQIYNRRLTPQEIADVRAYLTGRWS
jgi:hypothetical protein